MGMKPVRDIGHAVEFLRPIKVPRYDPARVPDPGLCTDCLIIINDRSDGQPRARLALSNGASWDYLPWAHETQSGQIVDVVPMVRQAVRDTLPALMPPMPPMQSIAALVPAQDAPSDWAEDRKMMAQALLEMADTINELQRRVHFLEHNALADVTKEQAA